MNRKMRVSIINGETDKFALQGKMYKNNKKKTVKITRKQGKILPPHTLNGAVTSLFKHKVGNAVISNRINHYGVG